VKIGLFCLDYNGISWPVVLLFFPVSDKKKKKHKAALSNMEVLSWWSRVCSPSSKVAWDASLPEGTAAGKVFWSTTRFPTFSNKGKEKGACWALVQRQASSRLCLGR